MQVLPFVYILYFIVIGVGWVREDRWVVAAVAGLHFVLGTVLGLYRGVASGWDYEKVVEGRYDSRARTAVAVGSDLLLLLGGVAAALGYVDGGAYAVALGNSGCLATHLMFVASRGGLTVFVRWQYIVALAHYAAALVVVALVYRRGDWEVPVVQRFNVWESNGGGCEKGCTINEYEVDAGSIASGYLVSSFSFISGTHHLVCAAWGKDYEEFLLKRGGVAWLRWIDWGTSASAMIMLDGVLWLAPPTVQALVLQFAVMWLICMGGAGSEAAWAAGRRGDAWGLFAASFAPFVAMWAVQWSLFDLGRRGEGGVGLRTGVPREDGTGETPPDFVIIIIAVLFTTYASFPAAHAARLWSDSAKSTQKSISKMELVYTFLSFTSKIPLLAVYSASVGAREDSITVGGFQEEKEGGTDAASFVALGASVSVCAVLGTAMFVDVWINL